MTHFTGLFMSVKRPPPQLSPADHTQHPAGRVGTPEDIASMVSYLISPQAGFVTAQNFVVDGEMTRKMIYGAKIGVRFAIVQSSRIAGN